MMIRLVEAANQCTPVAFANGSKVTFFDMPTANWPELTQIGLGGNSFQWSYKPCDPRAEVPNAPQECPGSFLSQTGCDVQFTSMDNPVVVFDDYIMIKYYSTSKGYNWTASVHLRCNLNVRDKIICPNNQYDATGNTQGPFYLTFAFESRAFCTDASRLGPPSPPDDDDSSDGFQITWGVVFLISLFGPLILYLLVMIPWNLCKEGKRGREVCPNVDFWGSLPGLALDGITFLWSRLRGSHWQSCEDNNDFGGGGYGGREVLGSNGGYGSV